MVVGLMGLCVVEAMDLAVVVCGGCRWIWLSWARCSNFLCCLWLQPCKWIVSGGNGGGFFFFFVVVGERERGRIKNNKEIIFK